MVRQVNHRGEHGQRSFLGRCAICNSAINGNAFQRRAAARLHQGTRLVLQNRDLDGAIGAVKVHDGYWGSINYFYPQIPHPQVVPAQKHLGRLHYGGVISATTQLGKGKSARFQRGKPVFHPCWIHATVQRLLRQRQHIGREPMAAHMGDLPDTRTHARAQRSIDRQPKAGAAEVTLTVGAHEIMWFSQSPGAGRYVAWGCLGGARQVERNHRPMVRKPVFHQVAWSADHQYVVISHALWLPNELGSYAQP